MTTLTQNNKTKGFYLSVSCPGCGAELKLDDNYFVVHCSHCDSNHRIKSPDAPPAFLAQVKTTKSEGRISIDRYLKEKGLPLTASSYRLKKIYYPYWKIDAVLFKVRKRREKRVMASSEYDNAQEVSYDKDITEISLTPYQTTLAAGYNSEAIPYSIGMRSDYLKLEVFSEANLENDFVPVNPQKDWDEVKENLDGNIRAIKNTAIDQFGANKTELFFPKASIIFFPYLIYDFYNNGFDRFIIDGVTGRLVGHIDEPILTSTPTEEKDIEFGELKIEPHRCSNCSEDLPDRQSYVYICHNCQSVELVEDFLFSLKSIDFCKTEKRGDVRYLPFWSFELSNETAQILKPYFGGIFNSNHLLVPAFKISNIDAMFRLTKRVSASYPRLNPVELFETTNSFEEVNLKPDEALTFADIFIYKDKYLKGQSSPRQVQFQPVSMSLLYLPFQQENYFYVDSILNAVTFEKSLI